MEIMDLLVLIPFPLQEANQFTINCNGKINSRNTSNNPLGESHRNPSPTRALSTNRQDTESYVFRDQSSLSISERSPSIKPCHNFRHSNTLSKIVLPFTTALESDQ
ncbi:hypothetical protein Dimus_006320 [Dionaea muscipula]